MDNAKNFAKVTVSTGYDASATAIALSSGHGARLPTAPFNVTWWNSTDYGDPSDDPDVEIARVTSIATDTVIVTRAQEGTSASAKNTAGKTYKMIAGITAKVINTDVFSQFKREEFDTTAGQNTFTTAATIRTVLYVAIGGQPLANADYSVINNDTQVQTTDSVYPAGIKAQIIYIST